LLKGVVEVRDSPQPIQAAEMLLIRLAYAAELPTPDKLVKQVMEQGTSAVAGAPAAAVTAPQPGPRTPPPAPTRGGGGARTAPRAELEPEATPQTQPIGSFAEIMKLVSEHRETLLKINIERYVHLVRCERARIEIRLENAAPRGLSSELAEKLTRWTGERWVVTLVNEEGEPTLEQQARQRTQAQYDAVMREPLVQAAMRTFAGAKITAVREPQPEAPVEELEETSDETD
jgi:DNA polymerase-3 subunit gamma/tau